VPADASAFLLNAQEGSASRDDQHAGHDQATTQQLRSGNALSKHPPGQQQGHDDAALVDERDGGAPIDTSSPATATSGRTT
jgi:hypothetical protein